MVDYSFTMWQDASKSKAFLLSGNEENIFFLTSNASDILYENLINDNYYYIHPDFIYKFQKNNQIFYQTLPFFFGESSNFNSKLTFDKAIEPKWKITTDTKKILDYNCIKATTEFRGRQWIVWFTPDIPGDIFPWKLQGLPGAILEVSESKNIFSLKANMVILNINYNKPKILEDLFEKNLQNAEDYKNVITLQNKILKDKQNREIAGYPAGTIFVESPHYREGELEKTFEWEEEPKKP